MKLLNTVPVIFILLFLSKLTSAQSMVGAAWVDLKGHKFGCYWFDNLQVSWGRTYDLDSERTLYSYSLEPGYSPNDVVGIAWKYHNEMACAFYLDSKVSCGNSYDLNN